MIESSTYDYDDLLSHIILVQTIPYYNLTCLELAFKSESREFLALSVVQKFLNSIWIGNIKIEQNLMGSYKVTFCFCFKYKFWKMLFNYLIIFKFFLSCLSNGFLAPSLLVFEPNLTKKISFLDEMEYHVRFLSLT